ncbi:MAG: hypothetical protein ABJA78_01530 [Ferruginibacter sp.]
MKHLLLFATILLGQKNFAQEMNLSFQTGYAFGETNSFKKIMLFTAVTGGYEAQIKNDNFFSLSAGGAALKFSYTDTGNINVFESRYCLNINLSLKRYFFINQRSDFFIEFGPVFNYCLQDKKLKKKINLDQTVSQQNLGNDLGLAVTGAYKKMLTDKISIAIGVAAQRNYLFHYKNETDKIQVKTTAFSIAVYRKLGK